MSVGQRTRSMQQQLIGAARQQEALSRQPRRFGRTANPPGGDNTKWIKLMSVDGTGKYTVRQVTLQWDAGTNERVVAEVSGSDEFAFEINGTTIMLDNASSDVVVRAWPQQDTNGDPIWAFALPLPAMTTADEWKVLQIDDNDELVLDDLRAGGVI